MSVKVSRSVAKMSRMLRQRNLGQVVEGDLAGLESDLFYAFERMIWGLAGKISRLTGVETEELFGVGQLAFVKALPHYNREDVNLSTYVYHCIRRAMRRAASRNSMLTALSEGDVALSQRYEAALRSLNRPATFDEVAEAMGGLSKKERIALTAIQLRAIKVGDRPASRHEDEVGNYTDDESVRRWEEQVEAEADDDQEVALRNLSLSSNQQVVLDAWLNDGESGWGTRLADKLGVSRQMVHKWKKQIEALVTEAYLARITARDVNKAVA